MWLCICKGVLVSKIACICHALCYCFTLLCKAWLKFQYFPLSSTHISWQYYMSYMCSYVMYNYTYLRLICIYIYIFIYISKNFNVAYMYIIVFVCVRPCGGRPIFVLQMGVYCICVCMSVYVCMCVYVWCIYIYSLLLWWLLLCGSADQYHIMSNEHYWFLLAYILSSVLLRMPWDNIDHWC